MAELITKSNSVRKRCKEERGELMDLDREIEKRVVGATPHVSQQEFGMLKNN